MARWNFILLLIGFLLRPGFAQKNPEQPYNQGLQYLHSLQFQQAVTAFQEAIRKDAHFLPAYDKLFLCYGALGEWDHARAYFEELRKVHPANSYPLYGLGIVYFEQKNYADAIKQFQHSIDLKPRFHANILKLVEAFEKSGKLAEVYPLFNERIQDAPNDAFAHYGLACALFYQHRWREALSRLDTSLRLDPSLLDAHRLKVVILRDQLGELEQAVSVCDIALASTQNLQENDFAITFLLTKATLYRNAGKSARAIETTREAVEKSRKTYLIDREAEALSNLGVLYRETGENDRALQVLRRSFIIHRTLKNGFGEQKALSNIGDVFLVTGQMDSTSVYYEQALSLAKAVDAKTDIAASYGQLATLYFYLSDYYQSATYSDSAIGIYRKVDHKVGLTAELGNLGTVYYVTGEYEKAITYFDEARKLAEELSDKYLQEINLGNMGSIYYLLGEYSLALRYLEKAYHLAREMSSKSDEASWLGSIGTTRLALEDTTGAIGDLEEALSILKEVDDQRNLAITYANLGTIYTHQNKYQLAEQYFQKALAINRDIRNPFGVAETHNNLGNLYLAQKRFDRVKEHFQVALDKGNRLPSPKTIWDARYGLGRVNEGLGNPAAAIAQYKQAVETMESVRGGLVSRELKTSYTPGKLDVYHRIINLLFQEYENQKDPEISEEAFHYAEHAKARTLLDLLAESRIEIRKGVSAHLLDAEKTELQHIAQIQTHLTTEQLTPEDRKELLARLQEHEDKLRRVRTDIRKENPFYAQVKFPEPLTLKAVQKNLPDDTFLLEYTLGKDHSYLWVIGKKKYEWLQLPGRSTLAAQINRYYRLISQPPGIGAPLEAFGEKLTLLLLGTAMELCKEKPNLVIIPDGELHYFPYETLIVTGDNGDKHYLVESHRISYASSASVLSFLTEHFGSSRYAYDLLAFGDPVFMEKDTILSVNRQLYQKRGGAYHRLPFTSREVQNIANLFPSNRRRVYLRARAMEENVKAEKLTEYRVVHFATHGLIDEKTPDRSCILLTLDDDPAEDGFLQVQEIFDLKFNAQLVTLSACQTGRGKLVQGEGIIGLSQAFFYAGARSLLVSLWPVVDQTTADLMSGFYQFLSKGHPASEAMQLAKREFIQNANRTRRHPYYWAPFVLRGAMK